jgi:replicative superfamily II helicase
MVARRDETAYLVQASHSPRKVSTSSTPSRAPSSALHNKEFEAIYSNAIQTFNKIQMHVFQALYTSDENLFVGAPTGSGKPICAEFVLLKLWNKKDDSRAVCVEPYREMVENMLQDLVNSKCIAVG